MKRSEALQRRERRPSVGGGAGVTLWSTVGGVALSAAAAVVVMSIPNIKRYIKISTM